MNTPVVNIFWFRRDLRIEDNAGLSHALRGNNPVVPVFIFDRNILDDLEEKKDQRVEFIYRAIVDIQARLSAFGSTLEVYYGFPVTIFGHLSRKYKIENVFTNNDYEQYAIERDRMIKDLLAEQGIAFHTYKDQVIFEKDEILTDTNQPYRIFTPYSRKWKSALNASSVEGYAVKKYYANFFKQDARELPSLESLGFQATGPVFPSQKVRTEVLEHYQERRDFPALQGTSHLSVHLRFGTISIRELTRSALDSSPAFLNELIWRDFYQMVLWQFPAVRKGGNCKREFDGIAWRNNEKEFDAWCHGKTGYPFVDAGMRELNTTGFMHNRLRMVTASFLTKHLLIDWHWGEAYFAKKLLDYDYAANNGGWQWAAGTGFDAAPYFRVFNPSLQMEKFDPDLFYTKKWVPEMDTPGYPEPIVLHDYARERALQTYKKALGRSR